MLAFWHPIGLLRDSPVAFNLQLPGDGDALRRAGVEARAHSREGGNEEMDSMEHWLGGVVVLFLMAYLVYALARPERF